ncbi:MAG: hypothetical protein COW08_08610 [Ignavibacteriales bacterium CG12_big_fil_rev_8_21_14_0_65_30_8]|nr:MAG: hypothetical protein COW08_08610 [Ignavibacteriales bacterium CG12_big_fil_rev_8_21_14_0_65_30_8]
MNKKNIIIIGGNAAGPAAAAKAKRVDPNASVIMIEAGEYISTGTCELPYVLAGEIDDYNDIIFFNNDKFRDEKGVDVLTNHFVESINKKEKEINVFDKDNGKNLSLPYDKLILCTGSSSIELDKYKNYNNVFTLKNISDYLSIKNYISNNKVKNALVAGSGYIGLEATEALSKLGLNVTLLELEKLPFPQSELEVQNLILQCLENNNINYYGNAKNVQIISTDERIKNIKINGRVLDIDFVIIAVGVKPNTKLAKDTGLDIGVTSAIKVNNKLRTCNTNIYAAGDNIEIINAVTLRPDYFPLATIAHQTGHIAGENAAGSNLFMQPVVKNIAVKIFDYYYAQVGLSQKEAETYNFSYEHVSAVKPNLVKVMPESRNVFGKIIYDNNSKLILGATFLGGQEVSGYANIISTFIHNKIKSNKLRDIDFNYTPPLSPMINLLSVLGRKIN